MYVTTTINTIGETMGILDAFRTYAKKNKPILKEFGSLQAVRDRYSNYPSQGLTPERLSAIFKEADQGIVNRQAELFEEMEEKDSHLSALLHTRKLAVAGLAYDILPASDNKEDIEIAEKAKEMFNSIEHLEELIPNILDGIGKGYSVNELIWELSEGDVRVKEIRYLHPKRFTFYTKERILNIPRILTKEEPVNGEKLLENKFLYFRHHARSGTVSRTGLLRPIAYLYLFKNHNIKNWIVFNELFSVPARIGKYHAGATEHEIEVLKKAVFNLGSDAAAVISDSTLIEFVEARQRGDIATFSGLTDYCDRSMSKVILGHTSNADATAGRLGTDTEARDIREDLLQADSVAVENLIRTQLFTPWVRFQFGDNKKAPLFKLHYEKEEDLERLARIYSSLIKDIGFTGIGADFIRKRFGIPEPKESEESLPPNSKPAQQQKQKAKNPTTMQGTDHKKPSQPSSKE